MKNPIPNIDVPLPTARVWSLLAIAALPLCFSTSLATAAQVATAEVVAIPTAATGVMHITTVTSDQAGSWVATAHPGFSGPTVIYGVLAGSSTSTPGVLRVPQTLSGYTQASIFQPRVRGLNIAYTAIAPSPAIYFSSWINDDLIAQSGDLIGTTGLEWLGSDTPRMTSTQRVFIVGSARNAGTLDPHMRVVVRYPAQTLALAVGDTQLGLSGPVTGIRTFESSPNGNSWVAVVTYESAVTGQEEMAIIDTGNVYTYGPSFTRARTENSTWTAFVNAYVDNDRKVVLLGRDHLGPVVRRDGLPVLRGPVTNLYDVDEDGLVLTDGPSNQGIETLYDGMPLDRIGANGVDATGDGFPDAGWAITGQSSSSVLSQAAFLGDGQVLLAVDLQVPGSGNLDSIVLASLALPNDVVCDGVPNSTGSASSIRAVGVDQAFFNDLELRLVNLPPGATVIPLVSSTSGFTANPAGSAGNLCLGGAIGRGIPFATAGQSTIRVYPQSLPQPNGFTAAQAGQTWFFQAWHRDATGGVATSNFSDALAVTFR